MPGSRRAVVTYGYAVGHAGFQRYVAFGAGGEAHCHKLIAERGLRNAEWDRLRNAECGIRNELVISRRASLDLLAESHCWKLRM